MLTLPPRYHPSLEQIGQGGFGVVYKTVDQVLSTEVAVKVPYKNRGEETDDELHREVATELQAASILRHPAIIQMLDGGITAEGDSFLVMEYAGAGSMQQWIQDEPPPWDVLAPVLDEVLAGLSHAHAARLVHRDIKAENILLSRSDSGELRPKIADFGLAKVMERRGYRSTRMGAGTLLYMPPEQFEDDTSSIHPGADLYAFGVLAYLLLAGRPPYEGAGEFAMVFSKVNNPPSPFTPRTGYSAPAGLDRWMRRLLEPNPADRYHLAADVRSDLQFLLGRTEGVPSLPSEARSLVIDKPLLTSEPALPERPSHFAEARSIPASAAMTGFRLPRFVDRDGERAELWATARAATQQATAMRVDGPIGAGRSRLCQWLAQTLEEGGHARTLHVRLDPETGIADALGRALRNFLYLGNLQGPGLSKRIGAWLSARNHPDAGDGDALAAWLDPQATREAGARVSLQNRLALLDRVLCTEAARGLVGVWVEDLRTDGAGARLSEDLVRGARASRFPLLVLWEPPGGEGAVTTSEHFRQVVVSELADDDVEAIVGELLPDGPALRDVVKQAGGNARLAVETARLEASNPAVWPDPEAVRTSSLTMRALDVDESADPITVEVESPTVSWAQRSLQHIGRVRMEAFVGGAGAAGRSETLLQLLALLPRPCDPSLLRRALLEATADRKTGPSFGALVDNARAAGLVVSLPDGNLDFASAPLADGARDLVDRDPVAGSNLRRAAAEALLEGDGEGAKAGVAAGRLLLAGGDPARALDLLAAAADKLVAYDIDAAQAAFLAAGEAAAAMGLPADDPRRVEATLGAARAARNGGDFEQARALLDPLDAAALRDDLAGRVLEVQATLHIAGGQIDDAVATGRTALARLGPDGDVLTRARVNINLGEAFIRRRDLEQAKATLQTALEEAREAGSIRVEVDCLERLARVLRDSGDVDGALGGFQLALEIAQQLGDLRMEGIGLRSVARLRAAEGDHAKAEALIRQSVEVLDRGGYRIESAITRSDLGEIARSQGRLADARREYGSVLAVARAYGAAGTRLVALFNLGLTEIALGRASRAQRRMSEIDEVLPPGTPHRFRVYFEVLRFALLTATQQEDDAAAALDDLLDGTWGKLPPDSDIVELLERAVGFAATGDDPLLASDACQLALELAEEAGDDAAAERLRARRSTLG